MPEPRHARSRESRFDPVLSVIATLADTAVGLIGMLVLALTLIVTVYGGITGGVDPLGILITTALLAAVAVAACRLYNRSGARR